MKQNAFKWTASQWTVVACLAATLTLAVWSPAAYAQQAYPQGPAGPISPGPTGPMYGQPANPMGRDYRSGINSGNAIISGNTTGGTAFRGFSPIRDPSAFNLGAPPRSAGFLPQSAGVLPSDTISPFTRDSVGVNDLSRVQQGSMSPRGITPGAGPGVYYPGSTVTNTGQIVRGLNQPGTAQVYDPNASLRSLDYRPIPGTSPQNLTGTNLNMAGQPNVSTFLASPAGTTPSAAASNVNERLLRSLLFNGETAAQGSEGLPTMGAPGDRFALDTQRAALLEGRDARPNTAFNRLQRQAPGEQLTAEGQPGVAEPTLIRPRGPAAEGQAEAQPGGLIRPSGAGSPEQQGAPTNQTNQPRGPQVLPTEMLNSFQGMPDKRMNELLGQAETLLHQQRYYDAARRYEMAHMIQMESPMPLFGRSMALLAAGDYLSSFNDLFMAIRMAGPQGAIRVNLKQFVPDVNMLDRRRAFMEQQLEGADDFRMRFLLGWAEYMTGQTEQGLANMNRAVQLAPGQMDVLRDYVKNLVAVTTRPAPTTQP